MPFYIRKSLRLGPIRFNISKSGVGVSAGVKGLRVGAGPRGHYIQAGAGGIYYRNTFSSSSGKGRAGSANLTPLTPAHPQPAPTEHTDLRQIESADATALVDADSSELIAEMNRKRQRWRLAPLLIGMTALLIGISMAAGPQRADLLVATLIAGVLAVAAARFDQRRKATVLFYDLAPPVLGSFEMLCAAFDTLANCEKAWNIETEAKVVDRKYSGGATKSMFRHPSKLATKEPPGVKTNISTPCIPVGRQELYFFPDRLLVFDPSGVGTVPYADLRITCQNTRFIEEESVPSDSQVVDRTWQYVNKKGGPDRRFRQNREIPVVLYGEVSFTSASGLNERIQISRAGAYETFVHAVSALAASLTSLSQSKQVSLEQPAPAKPRRKSKAPRQKKMSPAASSAPPSGLRVYYFDSDVKGPITMDELDALLQVGQISTETKVCVESEESWQSYQQLRASLRLD